MDQARSQGAVLVGGRAPEEEALRRGFFFEPTLFDEVMADAPIAQEEIFGPVLVMLPFRDLDEAAAVANRTSYGLVAGVWTRDVARAHRLVNELEVGQVFVNTYGAGGGVELPFGGHKLSGYGREKGLEGLLAFTRTKTAAIDLT